MRWRAVDAIVEVNIAMATVRTKNTTMTSTMENPAFTLGTELGILDFITAGASLARNAAPRVLPIGS